MPRVCRRDPSAVGRCLRIVAADHARRVLISAAMFVVLLTYVKPLEDVDKEMKAHVAFLRACYSAKVFVASGRRVPRTGGVILARAPSKEELAAVMDKDPFVREGIAT